MDHAVFLRSLLLAAVALAAALGMHTAYRLAERWEAAGPGRSRDAVMLPVLLAMALAIAGAADWLGRWDPDLLQSGGFALFLGLALGQRLPRPPRRRR